MKWMCCVIVISSVLIRTEAQNTGQGISLSQKPEGGRTRPGHDVVFTCTVDLNILSDQLIQWVRRVGTIHTKIAIGTIKQDEFVSINRYKLSKREEKGNKFAYTLTITDVHYEDAGTIECSILQSSRKDAGVLAICDDPSSDSCSCVQSTGWSSPECFGESKSVKDLEKAFNRTVVGLGVCFAIAVIYSIVVTVFFARDCMKIIHKKNQLKLAMIKNQQRGYNPHVDSDRLTVDDDLGSIPESGVWSQSDGRNDSERSNGRRYPRQSVQNAARPQELTTEQPIRVGNHVTSAQSHVNPAFNPDDVEGGPPQYDTAMAASGGVRPKIPQQRVHPPTERIPPNPAPSQGNDYEYIPPGQHMVKAELNSHPYPRQNLPNPEYTPQKQGQPLNPDQQSVPVPSSVRSERHPTPERPPPPQRSYTDLPVEKQHSRQPNGYASPQRLNFEPANLQTAAVSGSYIDQHDTVI